MNSNQTLFTVKFQKILSELEINESTIKCVTGKTTHFEIDRDELRSFIPISSSKILINFYSKNELYQVTISSKHCINIMKSLNLFLERVVN